MPGKSPRAQRPLPDQPITPADRSVESSLELPHERDEAVDMTGEQTSPLIEQAERDVRKGLKDTSKGPEMDRAYKSSSLSGRRQAPAWHIKPARATTAPSPPAPAGQWGTRR